MKYWLLVFVVLASKIGFVSSNGKLYVGLLAYNNSQNLDFDGNCCDGTAGTDHICSDNCDLVFQISIYGLDGRNITNERLFRNPINYTNHIMFNLHDLNSLNPASFDFKKWPGSVKLVIQIYDRDIPDARPDPRLALVDIVVHDITQTTPTKDFLFHGLNGTRKKYPTSLRLIYRYSCDPTYYGKDCLTDCLVSPSQPACPHSSTMPMVSTTPLPTTTTSPDYTSATTPTAPISSTTESTTVRKTTPTAPISSTTESTTVRTTTPTAPISSTTESTTVLTTTSTAPISSTTESTTVLTTTPTQSTSTNQPTTSSTVVTTPSTSTIRVTTPSSSATSESTSTTSSTTGTTSTTVSTPSVTSMRITTPLTTTTPESTSQGTSRSTSASTMSATQMSSVTGAGINSTDYELTGTNEITTDSGSSVTEGGYSSDHPGVNTTQVLSNQSTNTGTPKTTAMSNSSQSPQSSTNTASSDITPTVSVTTSSAKTSNMGVGSTQSTVTNSKGSKPIFPASTTGISSTKRRTRTAGTSTVSTPTYQSTSSVSDRASSSTTGEGQRTSTSGPAKNWEIILGCVLGGVAITAIIVFLVHHNRQKNHLKRQEIYTVNPEIVSITEENGMTVRSDVPMATTPT